MVKAKKHKLESHSSYLQDVYDPKYFKKLVKKMTVLCFKLRAKEVFDTIAFTGSSGAAMAYPVAASLGCGLSHIRRPDGSHYMTNLRASRVEGVMNSKKFIIIDDMIDTGKTIDKILTTMQKNYKEEKRLKRFAVTPPECVGIVLYANDLWRHEDEYDGIKIYTLSRRFE